MTTPYYVTINKTKEKGNGKESNENVLRQRDKELSWSVLSYITRQCLIGCLNNVNKLVDNIFSVVGVIYVLHIQIPST